MTQLSNYGENAALDLAISGQSWTISARYFALAIASIVDTDTGSTITEPSGGSYARAESTDSDWNTPADGAIDNSAAITFPTPSAEWGGGGSPIVDLALLDASSAGNLILYLALASSKVASVGSTPSLGIGDVSFSWYRRHISDYLANAVLSHIFDIASYSPPATLYLAPIKLRAGVEIDSVTNATNTINEASHGLSNGDVLLLTNSGGALPTGLSEQTRYFVVNAAAGTFQLATRPGGSVVTFSDDGSGTNYYHLAMRTDGGGGVEGNYAGYSRGSLTNNLTNFPAASGGSKSNATAWVLGAPTGASDELAEWAVYDADVGSGNAVTFTNATNVLNDTSHGLSNGDPILLQTDDTLPAELEANRVYFVINANANDFQIADTEGGSAIAFTDDGTGNHTWHTPGNLLFVAAMDNRITPGDGDTVQAGVGQVTFTLS